MGSVFYIYTKYFIVPLITESRFYLHKIMDTAVVRKRSFLRR